MSNDFEKASRPNGEEADVNVSSSRALIVVNGGLSEPSCRARPRPNSAFITQLLAVKLDMPQTRAKRREAPALASQAYRATLKLA